MEPSTLTPALIGGALCGVSAVGLMATHGRIAGFSGLLGSATARGPVEDRGSRLAFVGGLIVAGLALGVMAPATLALATPASVGGVVLAGALVGAGSRLANGCTSGHGLCGVARMSPRSLVAVTLFCAVGAVALVLTRALMGGAS